MKDWILIVVGLIALAWTGVKVVSSMLDEIDRYDEDDDKNL